jgi:predicted alpha/beta hydrolase family esterase
LKKAVILHGTGGSPKENWFPWLINLLEGKGYEVWAPLLPNNLTPNRQTYNNFLFGVGWNFADNLIFGHSSGAVSVLNLLEDERCPRIKTGVLVGAWSHMDDTDLDDEQFKDLFPTDGFDFDAINQKADNFLFLHGDNDPYCPLDQAQWLAKQTGSEIIIIPGGGHLGSKFPEFPQMTDELETRGWL